MKTVPVAVRLLGGIAAVAFGLLVASGPAAATTTGSISGTVVDTSTRAPVAGIEVCAVDVDSGAEVGCASTDSSGAYTVDALPPGTYKAYFSAFDFGYYTGSNYAAQFYPEKDSWDEAISIVVAGGAPTEHIDAELHKGAEITGTVKDASTNDPLGSIEVCVHPPTDKQEAEEVGAVRLCRFLTPTENDGGYAIGGLPTGEYVVEFWPESQNYIPQFWDGKRRWDEAELVTATEGATTSGIDAQMEVGGQITGTVVDAVTSAPIEDVEACAYEAGSGELARCGWTEAGGTYTINGLASGSYKVQFEAEDGAGRTSYVGQYYDARGTLAEADPVSVTAGATTPGIGAELVEEGVGTPPVPSTRPSLSGQAAPGATLSCSVGTWGNNPDSFSYGWFRDGIQIGGEDAGTYVVQTADEGHKITCVVTATNAFGSTPEATDELFIPTTKGTHNLRVVHGIPPAPTPVPSPKQPRHQSRDAVAGAVAIAHGSKVLVRLRCPGKASCGGVVKLMAEVKRPRTAKRHRVVVGKSHFSVRGGHQATVRVRLTSKGKKLIRQAGKQGVTVRLVGSGIKSRSLRLKP